MGEAHLHFRNHKILPRTGSPKERKNGRYTLKNAASGDVRKRHSRELSTWSLQFPSLFFRTAQKRFPRTTSTRSPNHKSGASPHEAHEEKTALRRPHCGARSERYPVLATADALAQAQSRERIEVTGSNIKRTDTEPPSVVQVITREQIERSGATSVAELLREIPASPAAAPRTSAGAAASSGQPDRLAARAGFRRDPGPPERPRVTPAPYADPNIGQGTSFNLNSIPLSAVERIDVLKDGASAIYGSDAIAA